MMPIVSAIEIDHTPLDNSKFIPQNPDTYLLAAAESEAHGKYDLLTTVIHEMAHLYGFMDGYLGFDGFIEVENLKSDLLFDKITAYGKRTDSRTIEEWQHKAIWSLIMFSFKLCFSKTMREHHQHFLLKFSSQIPANSSCF
jgi:hypothetical protein